MVRRMIAAYCILHYGKEWLQWSIRSVIDYVDEFHIFYTPYPSHGFSTTLHNPETREQLMLEIIGFIIGDKSKLYWHDCGRFQHEGYHREFAVQTCVDRGADMVLVVDADEIWAPDVLENALTIAASTVSHSFRIGMRHFWRSLKWICDDPAAPTRIIRPNISMPIEAYVPGKVFHMGYAQSPAIINYKMSIHGHSNEIRKDWFREKFMEWKPGDKDVHPTCSDNFWEPKPYVDDGTLKRLVGDHIYWDKEIIT